MTTGAIKIRHQHFLEPDTLADPYPLLATLRTQEEERAAERLGSIWLTRYDSVATALRHPHLSVAAVGEHLNRLGAMALHPAERPEYAVAFQTRTDLLFYIDPPRHTHLRRLLQSWFSPAYIEGLRCRIAWLTGSLLDDMDPAAPFDIIAGFVNRLPALVIAEIIGMPDDECDVIIALSDGLVATASRGRLDRRWTTGGRDVIESFRAYLRPHIIARMHRPRPDLLSSLVRAMETGACTEQEVASLCMTLAVGGYETTRGLIANALATLLRHPDELCRLRNEPGLIDFAIEEVIRFESPVQVTARIALEDVEIGSVRIETGRLVECFIGAANRDPDHFCDPDRFDIQRSPNRHLGFSLGHHHCLGIALARMEARVAISSIFARWPDLHLDQEAIEWKQSAMFRQPTRLVVNTG